MNALCTCGTNNMWTVHRNDGPCLELSAKQQADIITARRRNPSEIAASIDPHRVTAPAGNLVRDSAIEVDIAELHTSAEHEPVGYVLSFRSGVPYSDSAREILQRILPQAISHFLTKNRDYVDQHATEGLGSRAEFVGIWRKIHKLKRAVWHGRVMQHEDVDEMLNDMIGSSLLMKHLRSIERGDSPAIESQDEGP